MQTSAPGLPPFKITLNLTATVEGSSTVLGGTVGSPPVTRLSTTTTHWTSQSLLKIAENKLDVNFPTNASLAQSGTDIVVVDATGTNVVENLTADGLATLTLSDSVVGKGVWNLNTGEQTKAQSYIFKFSFDDGNGNSFNLTGSSREKFSMSAWDRLTDHVKITETVSSTLIGEGAVGGGVAVFSGSSLISGKGTWTVQSPIP